MGQLVLPTSGKVYCDASLFIYTLESHPIYSQYLIPFWHSVQQGQIEVMSSELSLLEVMVKPIRVNNLVLKQQYERFLTGTNLRLIPIDKNILIQAAHLCATFKVRSPDSIHLSTAQECQATMFFTNDHRLRTKTTIPVITVDDLVQP